jgi:hypothetical protein
MVKVASVKLSFPQSSVAVKVTVTWSLQDPISGGASLDHVTDPQLSVARALPLLSSQF